MLHAVLCCAVLCCVVLCGLLLAGRPVMFTGEMVFPWMFDDVAALRPLKEAAEVVAAKEVC